MPRSAWLQKDCHWRGKGVSTPRQSDSFKVTQTCNWKPELLHPDLCPPYCRWLQTGVKPCSLSSGDASKLLTKVVWLIFSLREPRELAGFHAKWEKLGVGWLAAGAGSAGSALSRSEVPRRVLGPRSLEAPCARLAPGCLLCCPWTGRPRPCWPLPRQPARSLLPQVTTRAPQPQFCRGRVWKGCRTQRGTPCEREHLGLSLPHLVRKRWGWN